MLNRRNFIKNAILGGTALASINALADDISASVRKGKNRTQKFNMHGYAAPRIDDLRIGVIGLGVVESREDDELRSWEFQDSTSSRARGLSPFATSCAKR